MEVLFGFCICLSLCCGHVWGFLYRNTSTWSLEHEQCDECAQSPIHLVFSYAEVVQLPDLVLKNYDKPDVVRVTNKGDTVLITANTYLNATVTGGHHVGSLYQVESITFHWGAQGVLGSEHKVDFRKYALEMQILHRNVEYKNLGDALLAVNGFLMFSILFNEVRGESTVPNGIQYICAGLDLIEDYGTSTTIDEFILNTLFTRLDMERYFEYCGSLTKPPCTPNAVWIVFPHILDVSEKCMKKFRSLRDGSEKKIVNNFRPLQPIMNRRIFYHMSRPWG